MSSPTLTERVQRTISALMHHPLTVLGASLHWLQASCPGGHSPRASASAQKVLVSTNRGKRSSQGARKVPRERYGKHVGSRGRSTLPLCGNGLHEGERTNKECPHDRRFNKQAGSRAAPSAQKGFRHAGGEAGCAAYMELV
jgi:hypothetical protein